MNEEHCTKWRVCDKNTGTSYSLHSRDGPLCYTDSDCYGRKMTISSNYSYLSRDGFHRPMHGAFLRWWSEYSSTYRSNLASSILMSDSASVFPHRRRAYLQKNDINTPPELINHIFVVDSHYASCPCVALLPSKIGQLLRCQNGMYHQ